MNIMSMVSMSSAGDARLSPFNTKKCDPLGTEYQISRHDANDYTLYWHRKRDTRYLKIISRVCQTRDDNAFVSINVVGMRACCYYNVYDERTRLFFFAFRSNTVIVPLTFRRGKSVRL